MGKEFEKSEEKLRNHPCPSVDYVRQKGILTKIPKHTKTCTKIIKIEKYNVLQKVLIFPFLV